jgi:hypothetical protein
MLSLGANSAIASQLEAAGGIETGIVRDDLSVVGTNAPTNAQYGADLLTQNTLGQLALTKGPALTAVVQNIIPQFDSFVGLKLHSNPTATTTSVATGYAVFADFQKSEKGAAGGGNSPVYPDNVIAPWRVDINGAKNAAPNVVKITGVGLYFPVLGVEVRGNITGTYVNKAAGFCTGGGIRLDILQPGLLLNGAAGQELGINNTIANKNAFLCIVSADNYVYPTVPKELGPLTGEINNN